MVREVEERDIGLKILREPSTGLGALDATRTIDIIAIHGIGAHPNDTWTKSVETDKGVLQYVNWLTDDGMLAAVVPNARIMRYGYESQWFGEEAIQIRVVDVATELLKEIRRYRKDCPNRPLIFIAHCFGGLIVIKSLIEARRAVTPSEPLTTNTLRDESSSSTSPEPSPSNSLMRKASKRPRGETVTSPQQPPRKGAPSFHGRQRSFCTQACLHGLLLRQVVDPRCPNVLEHRPGSSMDQLRGKHHEITTTALHSALTTQFRKTRLDEDFVLLRKRGTVGALFKVTLWSHGYTVAGKASRQGQVRFLEHEEQVYKQLLPIQGKSVPVCIGSMRLPVPFYHDFKRELVHVLLLSWGGNPAVQCHLDSTRQQRESKQMVKALGIKHDDLHDENILYCDETRTCMVIDFQGASIVPIAVHPQIERLMSTGKRKRRDCEASEVQQCSGRKVLKQAQGKRDSSFIEPIASLLKHRCQ